MRKPLFVAVLVIICIAIFRKPHTENTKFVFDHPTVDSQKQIMAVDIAQFESIKHKLTTNKKDSLYIQTKGHFEKIFNRKLSDSQFVYLIDQTEFVSVK